MKKFVICGWAAAAVIALSAATLSQSALAQPEQKGSLALPLPAPVPAPSSVLPPTSPAPQEATHSRSAHRNLKLEPDQPKTETEAGNSPLQGAGPPQGNSPVAVAQGAGPLMLSPLQGAGPVSAREMLLGSAATLGTK